MNALYWVMLLIAGALFLLVNGALIALAFRFRARRGVEPRRLHSRPRGCSRSAASSGRWR